jgi:hypothetical protein
VDKRSAVHHSGALAVGCAPITHPTRSGTL